MEPHDFSTEPFVAVSATWTYQFLCPECNWTQLIATESAPPVQQCFWCGWPDIEPVQKGAFASFVCSVHGQVTCIIPSEDIRPDDFMTIFCPHCRVQPRSRSAA